MKIYPGKPVYPGSCKRSFEKYGSELFGDSWHQNHTYYEIGKPVRSIYIDKKENMWIGAEGGGLILFDPKNGKIAARYSDADGLSNNAVLNILEDNKGQLWLSTFNGLSRFNTSDKSFKNYYQDDGLQSNQFLYNAALRLQTGELAFGGIKGLTIFCPDSIAVRQDTPALMLTGLRIDWKEAGFSKTVEGRYLCLEVLNGQRNGDPLASIAEIEVIGNDGKVLSTQNWKVVYASSEEITSGNHGAEKIYDQQESTFWQSQSVGAKPDYPHQIVLDLGTIEQISRLRYLPRSDKKTEGMVKEYKVYIKKLPFQL